MNSERDRAIDSAYREHAPDVYRVAFAILRDPDEAIDAMHEAFARAWERWEQYDSHRSLRAWLHGIVVHEALDQLRRRRVRRLRGHVLRLAETESHAHPRDVARDATARGELERAMAQLKPDVRAVLVLRHYYGYEYAEIAGFIGSRPGSVGSTLSRAHAQLRRLLGAADDEPGRPEEAPSRLPSEDRPTTPSVRPTPPEATP
jgi:RNA polymerase sigma-70 factor (ECF subfamily)